MSLSIQEATRGELSLISELAKEAYWATYSNILSKEQIVFMLENIYSVSALQKARDMEECFYLAMEQTDPVGFIALKPKESSILRIEKLYLLSAVQGKGYGKVLIDHAAHIAQTSDLHLLELNVNRGNKAYRFYLKQGFEVVGEVDIPYYGFVLDDYVMQKRVIYDCL